MTEGADAPDLDDPDYGQFPLRRTLGFEMDTPEPGVSVATVEVDGNHLNPNGVVHGGVLFTMADTAMGGAAMSVLDDGQFCASIECHLRFLKPVTRGRIEARARVMRRGRRIVHLATDITVDGADEPVATATASFAVLEAPT